MEFSLNFEDPTFDCHTLAKSSFLVANVSQRPTRHKMRTSLVPWKE